MRWDLIVGFVAALAAFVWYKFFRFPPEYAHIPCRVPLAYTWNLMKSGEFMKHIGSEKRRRLIGDAPISVQWAFGWTVYVHDVDLALDVVRHSPSVWHQTALPSAPWSLAAKLWGTGLPTANGRHWKSHRVIAHHAFSTDALRHMSEISFRVCGKQLADEWSAALGTAASTTVDVTDTLGRYGLISLGRGVFGFEFEASAGRLVNAVVDQILQPSRYAPGSLYDLLPIEANRVAKQNLDALDALVYRLIRERRAFHAERAAKRRDELTRGGSSANLLVAALDAAHKPVLIDYLLTGVDDRGEPLPDNEVRDETLVFFLAGLDTSQLSLSTVAYFLAHNPRAQQRCYDELVRTCGETNVADPTWPGPTYDDTKHLEYAQACIWESIRLYRLFQPVREASQDVTLGADGARQYRLPKGTMCVVDVWSLHRNEKYWGADADRFRPERWLTGYDAADMGVDAAVPFAINRHAFFAFGGAGPRSCIGQNFTVGWQRAALSFILARFVLSPVPNAPGSAAAAAAAAAGQVDGDGRSDDLQFEPKGLFDVPQVKCVLTRRPGFGAAPTPRGSANSTPRGSGANTPVGGTPRAATGAPRAMWSEAAIKASAASKAAN